MHYANDLAAKTASLFGASIPAGAPLPGSSRSSITTSVDQASSRDLLSGLSRLWHFYLDGA
jgi:hypothetical protein